MNESSKLIASILVIQCPLTVKTPYHGDDSAWRELAIEKIIRICSKAKPAHVFVMRGTGKSGLPAQLNLELMDEIQGMLLCRHYVTVDDGAKFPDLLAMDFKKKERGGRGTGRAAGRALVE